MKKREVKAKKSIKLAPAGKANKKVEKPDIIEKKLISIGQAIRKARIGRGLSVQDLSDMCGIAVPQLYNIEKGANCTVKTLMKIRQTLRITITL